MTSTREELRAQIRARREPRQLYQGQLVPGSIPFLRGLLTGAKDESERDELLVEVACEYFRADMDDEHLLVQRERVQNHPDAAVMWLALAESLSRRADGAAEAREAAAKGVEISRNVGTLVRYALSCQARVARMLGDSTLFESVIAELIADAKNYRKEDCALVGDLVSDLPDGFCSPLLAREYQNALAQHGI